MTNKVNIWTIVSATAAVGSAAFAWWAVAESSKTNKHLMALSAVETRVQACTILSTHHYTRKGAKSGYGEVFIDTARGLTLCLSRFENGNSDAFEAFQQCVIEASKTSAEQYGALPKQDAGPSAC